MGEPLALMFVENVGQFDRRARYQVAGSNATIFLGDHEIWVTFMELEDERNFLDPLDRDPTQRGDKPRKGVNLKIVFPGANQHAKIEPFDRLETRASYLTGNDPAQWRTDQPVWSGVRYVDIFPGADLEISSKSGQLAWRFVIRNEELFTAKENYVARQGLRMKLLGQKNLAISNMGLLIGTDLGNYVIPSIQLGGASDPQFAQQIPRVVGNEVILLQPAGFVGPPPSSFDSQGAKVLAAPAEQTANSSSQIASPLLDGSPQNHLLYWSLIGGDPPGCCYDSIGWGIAVGEDGSIFVAGETNSAVFPITPGSFDSAPGYGAFVFKLNPFTGGLVYSTFIRGSDQSEVAYAIAIDQDGAAYVGGETRSADFPIRNGYDSTLDGPKDGFILKLNPLGNDLIYSTYYGGALSDRIQSIALDVDQDLQGQNIYSSYATVVSCFSGSCDSAALKINLDGTPPIYITPFGADDANSIAVKDDDNFVYVAGTTSSKYVFVTSLDADGGTNYFTSFGGSDINQKGYGVAVDAAGNAYVTGWAGSSADFPTTSGALRTQGDSSGDAFLTRLDTTGAISYSTYLGGSLADRAIAIAVDENGALYVVGDAASLDFPVTGGAIKSPDGWGIDTFALKLEPADGDTYYERYGTAVGGQGSEYTYSTTGTIDSDGNIYITGETNSVDMVGIAEEQTSDYQVFVVKISTDSPQIPELSTSGIGSRNGCFALAYEGTQGWSGNPINTRTGSYGYELQDISVPTSAGELALGRDYVSQNLDFSTTVSPGWTQDQDTRLILPENPEGQAGRILFKAHSGNRYIFDIQDDGSYRAYPGLCASLERMAGPPVQFVLKDAAQRSYTFDENGRLLVYADTQGHSWTYIYDGNGRLQRIDADGASEYLSLQYDAQGRLKTVSDQTGRSVTYNYDAQGDLGSFVDVLNQTWSYEYNNHLLTRVIGPDGVTIERTEYDAQSRAWRQFDGNDNLVAELTYNPDGTTTILDGAGNVTTHTYDQRGTLVAQTDGLGSQQQKVYDYNFRPGIITDSLGNRTQLAWSPNGINLRQIKDALLNQTDITYGSYNNPTSVIDPKGYETKYFYQDANFPTLPTKVEYPLSFDGGATFVSTLYEYYQPNNAEGQPPGKIKFATDPLGKLTLYTYTPNGQVASVTMAYGTPSAMTMTNTYDNLGNLIDEVDPTGIVTHNAYDTAGRLIRTVRNYDSLRPQNDQNLYNIVTEYRYDARGNQIATIDTYGVITRTYYDLSNRPVAVVQNLSGQAIEDAVPPARDGGAADQNIRTDTVYAVNGLAIASIDPLGVVTRTYYDSANRPVTVVNNLIGQDILTATSPLFDPAFPNRNIRTDSVYDDNGNLIATIDTNGMITRTYYDALNRPATVVRNLMFQDISAPTPPGRSAAWTQINIRTDTVYDENGNIIATVDPAGVTTRTYYDAMNRPVAMVQNLVGQNIEVANPPNRIQGATDENIRTDTYYDQAGNPIASVDPLGIVTRTFYDALNRPVTIVQNLVGQDIYVATPPARGSGGPDENVRSDTAYDQNGRRIASTDPLGRVTKYDYDSLGQLTQAIVNFVDGVPQNDQDTFNITTAFSYDAVGRQLTATDTLGHISTNAYDALGRLLTRSQNFLPGQPLNYQNEYNITTTYTYDKANHIAVTDTQGVVTRSYFDALGRAVTVVQNLVGQDITNPIPPTRIDPPLPDQNLRTDTLYRGDGNVDTVIDQLGKHHDQGYDALGRHQVSYDPLGNFLEYRRYNRNGNVFELLDGNLVATEYEYDDQGRLTAVIENYSEGATPDHETNVRTEYTYDSNGNRLSILDGNGHSTTFSYDSLGRLKTEEDALGHLTQYDYDLLGNRVGLHDANGQITIFGYDELNRLTLIDYPNPDADIQFDYDALGQRQTMTDGLGTTHWDYDALGRAESITDPFDATVGYGYDAAGNRTSLTYPDNSTVDYQYDSAYRLQQTSGGGLPGLVSYEYDATGRLALISRPNGVDSSYLYDDAGQLRDLTHTGPSETLASYHYDYDDTGNRIRAIEDVHLPALPNPTATPTFTATASPTATPTDTATHTPSPTATASPTPTDTPTNTPTDTPTSTPTNTSTDTPTQMPTNTATPTEIPSPTPTSTPTAITLILQPDGNTGIDTYIYGGSKNSNYGTGTEMGVGEDNNAANRTARSLLKFDLSAIPPNATITSATLSLWTSTDLSSNNRTIRVFRLKSAFSETGATWSSSASGTSWQTAGASGANDRESTDIGSTTILDNEALNLEKQIVLSPARILEMVNGTFTNNGFIVVADTELNDRFNYKTSESTGATQRPKLVIQYSVPTATPTNTPTNMATNTPTWTPTNIPPPPTPTPTSTNEPLTYTVSKTTDTNDGVCDADCSLREAVIVANGHTGPDTIIIPAGTYTLTIAGSDDTAAAGDLDITDSVTVQGIDAFSTIISGDLSLNDRIFDLPSKAPNTVVIKQLMIQNGKASIGDGGGGVRVGSFSPGVQNLTLERVILTGNSSVPSGGGLAIYSGSLTISDSAVINNSSEGDGGGILIAGGANVSLVNTTVSGNSANGLGGGIENTDGFISLTNVTISNNQDQLCPGGVCGEGSEGPAIPAGAGIAISTGTASLHNTIIAGNASYANDVWTAADCSGSLTSQGHNLIGDTSRCSVTPTTGDQFGTASSPIDPLLGPLGDNGGSTYTQALLTGSSAINAGDNNGCPATDQRVYSRDTQCDMGAYEFGAMAFSPLKEQLVGLFKTNMVSLVSQVRLSLTSGGSGAGLFQAPGDTETPTATTTDTPTPVLTLTPSPTDTALPTATDTPSPTPTPIATGPVTITYTYDPLNRLTAADYSTGDFYHYGYDMVGNRLTQEKSVGGLPSIDAYLYDNSNRLTSVNGVLYTWDNNGNLLSDGVNTYAYDSANKLKTMTGGPHAVSYTYNGLGDRLQETTDGQPTTFVMDLNAGLTQALINGATTYLYGVGRIAQIQGSGTDYFLGDALSSVRQMADAGGELTYKRSYDPYGAIGQGSGAGHTSYGYTSEYQPHDLIYLRARFYMPSMGRFLTRDIWQGDRNRPASLNRWAYSEEDPVNRTDATGFAPNRNGIDTDYSYSCQCGWIDWKHASPRDARRLISRVYYDTQNVPPFYSNEYKVISVSQLDVLGGIREYVVVRKWMDPEQERRVALGIFMELSEKFEYYQGSVLGGLVEKLFHSSFSEEDLTSDLIGFYVAALDPIHRVPESGENTGIGLESSQLQELVDRRCALLNKEDSLRVFDEYGEFQKIMVWEQPRLETSCFIDQKCGFSRQWPPHYTSIQPIHSMNNGNWWWYRGQTFDGAIRASEKDGVYHLWPGIASAPPETVP
jgi:RHS repeat-associated protein/CSLREA domain-containing protein